MSITGIPLYSSEPELNMQFGLWQGNTSSAPVKVYAEGQTASEFATGKLRITWGDHQGKFVGMHVMLMDSNPDNVKGFTVHPDYDSYTSTTKAADFWIYNASQALADPATTTYILVLTFFKRGVT